MSDDRPVLAAADVTADLLKTAEDVFEGFFDDDQPIDWGGFIDRLERWSERDWGNQIDSPAIRKVQRHIRAHRALEH